MRKNSRQCFFSLILVGLGAVCEAAPRAGGEILRMGGSARTFSMQQAHTAAAGDLDSLFYNPAGLASLARPSFGLTHAAHMEETNYDQIAYGHAMRESAWGVTVSRLGSGGVERRDSERRLTGSFSVEDTMAGLAFARSFGGEASVGAEVKYIRSRIGDNQAMAVSFDAGTVAKLRRNLWVGMAILNVGQDLRYGAQQDPLPLTFAGGVAMLVARSLRLTFDLKHEPHDNESRAALGMEFSIAQSFSVRGGYASYLRRSDGDDPTGLRNLQGGLGLAFSGFQFDYAVTPMADLGISQRFTISRSF